MESKEFHFSNQEIVPIPNIEDDKLQSSSSMDSFWDEILNDTRACTHTHTCNPPGPDLSHTHTCFHAHTKILSADDTAESIEKKSKKHSSGNREAVRKYREKKKARAASLEDELIKLRNINQQLMKRLKGQAVLEAEITRLKCLLVDVRGRIEGEIGSFPYKKLMNSEDRIPNLTAHSNLPGAYAMNPCDDEVNCLHRGVENEDGEGGALNRQGFGGCDIRNMECMGNLDSGKEWQGCGYGSMVPIVRSSLS